MKAYLDDDRKWVIVLNMQSLITPIRHLIELHDVEYDKAEFAEWYYERYYKLDGDEFYYCLSTKEMRKKESQIIKEYDETMSKEERRKNWKEYCSKNAKKDGD